MCTSKSFIVNTAIFHLKQTKQLNVNFDFMETLRDQELPLSIFTPRSQNFSLDCPTPPCSACICGIRPSTVFSCGVNAVLSP